MIFVEIRGQHTGAEMLDCFHEIAGKVSGLGQRGPDTGNDGLADGFTFLDRHTLGEFVTEYTAPFCNAFAPLLFRVGLIHPFPVRVDLVPKVAPLLLRQACCEVFAAQKRIEDAGLDAWDSPAARLDKISTWEERAIVRLA